MRGRKGKRKGAKWIAPVDGVRSSMRWIAEAVRAWKPQRQQQRQQQRRCAFGLQAAERAAWRREWRRRMGAR